MIIGYVDAITNTGASGWACETDDFSDKLVIKIIYNNSILHQTIANKKREDLAKINTSADFAFSCTYEKIDDPHKIQIIAINSKQESYIFNTKNSTNPIYPNNDMFKNRIKLLNLPNKFINFNILTIGCNQTQFCEYAKNLGANQVSNIDINSYKTKQPKAKYECVDFINTQLETFADKKYDLILVSDINYGINDRILFDNIYKILTNDGKLILECDILPLSHIEFNGTLPISLDDKSYIFPTWKYLTQNILSRYDVRFIGQSAYQPYNNITRFVFHCIIKHVKVILVSGKSGSGKTLLSYDISQNKSCERFSIDDFVSFIKYSNIKYLDNANILKKIRNELDTYHIDLFFDNLTIYEKNEFAKILSMSLPYASNCIIIEGYQLKDSYIKEQLIYYLKLNDCQIWDMTRIN